MALRAFLAEDLVVILDGIRVFGNIHRRRAFLEAFDASLGFRIQFLRGGAAQARSSHAEHSRAHKERAEFCRHFHKLYFFHLEAVGELKNK